MEKLQILTESKKYPVFIGEDSIQSISELLKDNVGAYSKLLIITDETVASLHLEVLQSYLKENGQAAVHIVPAGESCKTFKVYEDCLSFAIQEGLDRKSVIIAFGGGAVGDLAGFVAASFMRGIRFVQVPTTILAHDSAVGGKVAINHPLGKNMVGAFHQPEFVLYDIQFLQTLPAKELRSGFAEAIKHALISDISFYEYLKENITEINDLIRNQDVLIYILKKGIQVKADIVEKDEKEAGVRAFLNFGHTLGHAIEAEAGYGTITHGEAVMIGMVFALKISIETYDIPFSLVDFISWIRVLGYQIEPTQVSFEQLWQWMVRDKKAVQNNPVFVLLKEIGEPELVKLDKTYLQKVYHELFSLSN
ncbi:3-dehydroquinate synthase [Falsibacillus albus]|uniref:3-dehydroquinate synthase n=1 Tax=Falsibacillus albus TaxID=2478915 RepID=A0A3L7JZI1_9BACI|nr:3-dehydroquinate synthase [Falsibacillus albus]RLQ95101.1 3-dehydroquinate synthase [Falsibacillus albus]